MSSPREHANGALGVETLGMTMRFGAFTALDDVSMRVQSGSFHALLGENGAGKSTLVKCMMGFYHATEGQMLVNGFEAQVRDPRDAHALGLGMVYQHFTLVPSLTAAENLVISRRDTPAVIDWRSERARLAAFMDAMPFKVPRDIPVQHLSAGERQKLEILKQLHLGRRFLILDEPTSVLTPDEADEVPGHVRSPAQVGEVRVNGTPYRATRDEAHALAIRFLPEEPLRNACAGRMSVTENIAFRSFDLNGSGRRFWLSGRAMRARAAQLVAAFKVRAASLDAPIASLSGGNVQRAVLARELTGTVNLLVISNPCFGLDFSAVAEIRARILAARNGGAAALLMSEDLDEVMELSDRILVMSEGRIAHETPAATASLAEIGHHMGGHA